jgi:hypothetical protein
MFSQKVQYNQKVQECQSLRTELSRFVTTPSVSTASSAASAHTGLSSTPRSSASPPSSRVASPTSSPSYISNIASPISRRLGLSRSASVAPTPPTRSASVAPTSPSRSGSTVPARTSTPGISSSSYRSATPAVPSFRSTTPVSPSPVRKSRTMSMSQPPPLPPTDRWPAALTASISKPFAPPAAPRPQGPRVPTRA